MKPLKQNLFTKAGLVWLLLVIVLLSCTQQPLPVGPGSPNTGGKNSVQKGFSVKATNKQCFSSASAYQTLIMNSGSIFVDVTNVFPDGSNAFSPDPTFMSTNSSTYITWYISQGNLYIGNFEAHAFSGPYGYHLYLSNSQDPIIIHNVLEIPDGSSFAANVTGAARYEYGSSAGNTYDLDGSISFNFVGGKIEITTALSGKLMPEFSGLGYSEDSQVLVSGISKFGTVPLVTCQFQDPEPTPTPSSTPTATATPVELRPCVDIWGPECRCPAGQTCEVLEKTEEGEKYCTIQSLVNGGQTKNCFPCGPGHHVVMENGQPVRCSNGIRNVPPGGGPGSQSLDFGTLAYAAKENNLECLN